jgi:hypothetical protein
MVVQRPDWWCYPEACQNGHEWGPGLITVSWVLCDCPAARATSEVALRQTGISLAGKDVTSKPHVIRERVPPYPASGLRPASFVQRCHASVEGK